MSTNSEEAEQKKRSQKIDKDLEEDSKRLRRECKILLLGMLNKSPMGWRRAVWLLTADEYRIWRVWQIHHCQADENHSPQWLQGG